MAVSVAVCEIFSVKEWCDLEHRVMVRSRSFEMAPVDISHTSFYSPSIVTMAISWIVCEIQRLIGRKSRNFYTPHVFSAPAGVDSIGILWKCLMLVKLEWLGYRMVKNCDDMLSRFHLIPERNGQTDGQTDRRRDGRTDLLYQYRASVCWHAIKKTRAAAKTLVFISPYSVAFGVILSLLFVFVFFVCLYGWGYLNAGWWDRHEILAQGRANTRDGNEVVRGWSAHGGPWGGGLNIFWGEGTHFRE